MSLSTRLKLALCFSFCAISAVSGQCVKCPEVDDRHYNVHLIAHSHMDLGWLKTFEQYYYGIEAGVSNDDVRRVYDSIVQELPKDKRRRFIFAETGYFKLWWDSRDDATKKQFRELVENGQLEFVNGGISMADEGVTHYENIIDQMSFGLNILNELFGKCGQVESGWQIDPFGHSKQFAMAMQQMNLKQIIYGRIDYQEKEFRRQTRAQDFKYRLSKDRNITVTLLPEFYNPPPNVCFEVNSCNDDVLVTDENSSEYNIKMKSDGFVQWVQDYAKTYKSNNLLIPMGGDFYYSVSRKWFDNLDSLIDFVNNNDYKITIDGVERKINVVYSTPTCYSRAAANQEFAVSEGDFLPYTHVAHAYWIGFYSGRPSLKYLVRWATKVYRSVNQLISEFGNPAPSTTPLRHALAVAQHHDALPGTDKQHVSDNYVKRLLDGIQPALDGLGKTLGLRVSFCQHLNASKCDISENLPQEGIRVAIYNPLAFNISTVVRLPIKNATVAAFDENGNALDASVNEISPGVISLAERQTTANLELEIPLEIPSMNLRQIKIKPERSQSTGKSSSISVPELTVVQGGNGVQVGLDNYGLKWIKGSQGETIQVNQSFAYYRSGCGAPYLSSHYIIRPEDGIKRFATLRSQKVIKTSFGTEIQQSFSDGVSQNIRILKSEPYVELDWIIGPIDVSDKWGKDFISVFQTNISSNDVFYTDSNGRDLIKRVRNKRDNWNADINEPIAGNYYPILSRISINNGKSHLTLLTDRAQGASSLNSGEIEVMLHRRCLCNDGRVIAEALDEPGFDGKGLQSRGTIRVYIGNPPTLKEDAQMNTPLIFFTDKDVPKVNNLIKAESLQGKIHVLTFSQVDLHTYILRLENFSETSQVVIKLKDLFNKSIQSAQLTDWSAVHQNGKADLESVEIQPLDIVTFIVKFNGE